MSAQTLPPRSGRKNAPVNLRALRLQRGIPLKDLASLLGVSVQAVNKAELGRGGLGKQSWYRLADFFGVDPRELEKPAAGV